MHKCAVCGITDEGPRFIGFHAFRGIMEVCDNCAEEHGCACGCYPSPTMCSLAQFMDYDLARDDNGAWQYVPKEG